MRYNIYMSADSLRAARALAYDTSLKTSEEMIKDMDMEELRSLTLQLLVEKNIRQVELQILRDSKFSASAEQLQLALFDQDGNPLVSEDKIQKQMDDFNVRHLDALKLRRETLDREIEAAEKVVKKQALTSSSAREPKPAKTVRIDETVLYEADPKETCPVCGKPMVHTGWKSRLKYKLIPAQLIVVEEKFETVSCPDKCTDENGKSVIRTVKPSEPDLIDKSPATESLVSSLVYQKYILDQPLYRMEKDFRINGIDYSRQTMSNVTQTCFDLYIRPVYGKILSDFQQLSVVHLDETPLKCLHLKETHKTSMMVAGTSGEFENTKMTVYRFFEGKKKSFVPEMLGDHFTGALMTDGLQAYESYSPAVRLNCMAHARRKFYQAIQARDDFKAFSRLKTEEERTEYLLKNEGLRILLQTMACFSDLYRVENEYKQYSPELLGQAREEISRPAFEELKVLVRKISNGFAKGSAQQKAAAYFEDREVTLGNYLENGNWPIDNNRCERAIKVFVMARKNFLFANSVGGANSAAGYLTLMQSALDNGIHPGKYIEYVLQTMKYYKDQPVPEEVLNRILPYSTDLPEDLLI